MEFMTYCNNSSKAALSVSSPRVENHIFNNPPLTISIEDLSESGIPVAHSPGNAGTEVAKHPAWPDPPLPAKWITDGRDRDRPGNEESTQTFSGSFSVQTGSTVTLTLGADDEADIYINGQFITTWSSFSGFYSYTFTTDSNTVSFSFQLKCYSLGFTNPTGMFFLFTLGQIGYILTASDLSRTITREYDNNPVYTVECDSQCPEGYCKCDSNDYPGYCCLPCASTASKINNIANSIRV